MDCALDQRFDLGGLVSAAGRPFPPLRNDPDPRAQVARGEIPLDVYETLKITDPPE